MLSSLSFFFWFRFFPGCYAARLLTSRCQAATLPGCYAASFTNSVVYINVEIVQNEFKNLEKYEKDLLKRVYKALKNVLIFFHFSFDFVIFPVCYAARLPGC